MAINRGIFLSLFLAFLVGISLVLFFNISTNQKVVEEIGPIDNLARLVNKTGRQRMLSQRIILTRVNASSMHMEMDSLVRQIRSASVEIDRFIDSVDNEYPRKEQLLIQSDSMDSKLQDLLVTVAGAVDDLDSGAGEPQLINAGDAYLYSMEVLISQLEAYAQWKTEQLYASNESHMTINNTSIIVIALGVLVFCLIIVNNYTRRLEVLKEELSDSNKIRSRKLEHIQFLISSIKVGIWERDVVAGHQFWSNHLYQMLGFEENEIPGTAEMFQELVHPEDLHILMESAEESLKIHEPRTIELRVKRKSGEYIWVEATGNAKRNEAGKVELLMAGISDINDRKILENQLYSFVTKAPAAIAMFDNDMNYLAYSELWQSAYNLKDTKLEGKNHYEVFPEITEEWKEIHRRCLSGESISEDADPFVRSDGTIQYIKWFVRPWYLGTDTIGGIIMFTEDVSHLYQETQRLSQDKLIAEEKAAFKTQFLANMSHEIRNPLNGIIGLANILKTDFHLPSQEGYIDKLLYTSQDLISLVNDVLDFNKLETQNLILKEASFEIGDFLKSLVSFQSFKCDQKGLKFVLNVDDALPEVISFDKTRLHQVLTNLLSNAIKFTNRGEVGLDVRLTGTSGDQSNILFRVWDTGVGIPVADQRRIFEAYEHVENTTNETGTGLGLFICKQIVSQFGGEISIQSEEGMGTVFEFEIRAKLGDRDKLESASAGAEAPLPKFKAQSSVLVVEDNTINQLIVKRYLSDGGLNVEIVSTGNEALTYLRSESCDLVLMDMQLPDMDGISCTERIRNELGLDRDKLPIIAFTGDITEELKAEAEKEDIHEVIYKPIERHELYKVVKRYIETDDNYDVELAQDVTDAISSLKYYCSDDKELMEEMIGLLRGWRSELRKAVIEVFNNKDPKLISDMLRKIIVGYKILKLKKLESQLSDLQSQFNQGNYNYADIEAILISVDRAERVIDQIQLVCQ